MSEPKTWQNKYTSTNAFFYARRASEDLYNDGWAHERDDEGWCKNCMAPPYCAHARLVPREMGSRP